MSANKNLIISGIVVLVFLPALVLAAELQTQWPVVKGINIGELFKSGQLTLVDLALYFYYAIVISGGVIAFIGLITGGIKCPAKASEAKKQVLASFFGLGLLLASWLILHTIDPQLLVLPKLKEIRPFQPPPLPKKPLTDGIIFYTNHPEFPTIEVPEGRIRVPDTRRFPVGGTRVDLDGRNEQGEVGIDAVKVTNIEIIDPKDEQGNDKYRYGAACFEHPGFRGRVRVFADTQGKKPSFDIPNPILGSRAASTFAPCGSILVFRMPPSKTLFADPTDKIIFYQLPAKNREKKNPLTLQREIIGGCLVVNYNYLTLPTLKKEILNLDKCVSTSPPPPRINDATGDRYDLQVERGNCRSIPRSYPPYGVIYVKVCDEAWMPQSMELDPANRYLVFLFQGRLKTETGDIDHWEAGNAYWFTSSVDDFNDITNKDLYWHFVKGGKYENTLPGGALIFRVEEIF